MKSILVGSTGFVGSNLAAGWKFDAGFHSSDIEDAFGTRPDLLVYAGVPAQKTLANRNPDTDAEAVRTAADNIDRIAADRVVLISTIDVYADPCGVDEHAPVPGGDVCPYGGNRAWLEERVMQTHPHHTVLRLPALFGRGLKKNLIYDLLHPVPSMLSEAKYDELAAQSDDIARAYAQADDGFFHDVADAIGVDRGRLEAEFERVGFSTLSFTDSGSSFQFFDLSELSAYLRWSLERELPVVNLAVEPTTAAEVCRAVRGTAYENHTQAGPVSYDFRSAFAAERGGEHGYFMDRGRVLDAIRAFVGGAR